MTGSERILARIVEDAEAAATQTAQDAENKAQDILRDMAIQAEQKRQDVLNAGQAQAQALLRTAQSGAALLVRNALLEQRRSCIADTLQQTLDWLNEQPDAAYFATLEELVRRAVKPQETGGVLYLNARDLQRLPVDFAARVTAGLPKGALTLSDQPRNLTGGFLLQYGDVELNGDFAAMLEARRDVLEDGINEVLFG